MPGATLGLPCCFNECSRLDRITIRFPKNFNSYSSIDFKKFDFAPKLELAGDLLHIEKSMFAGLNVARNLIISANVITIAKNAFWGCANLESIEIPDSVTHLDIDAFQGCRSLREIRIATGNQFYEAIGILLIEKKSKVLLKCAPSVKGELVIPDEVTGIGPRAFEGCMSLTSVVVPGSVEIIAGEAFSSFRFCAHETMCGSRRFELANEEVERRKSQMESDGVPEGLAEMIARELEESE
jgi:hypothetical protein